jgi:ATP-dependent helicase HrpB
VLRNGTGAILPPDDALAPEAFIVVAESDGGRPESRVFLAAPLSPDDIERDFAGQTREVDLVEWNDETGVVTHRQRRLDSIVLSQHRVHDPDPAAVAATLATQVRRRGLDMLPWSESAGRLRARLGFLHHHDASWPDVSDEALLDTLLPPLLQQLGAVRRASDLRRIDVHEALLELLSREQRARLDQLAPTHFTAPSGSRIPISYDGPAAPSAAVRLQEMFGATRSPLVLAGRVPLTLQLLSPSQRPVQVTRDLASFWQSSYFEVRKDLRARYPKHHWPDDPLSAIPTSRARGRRRE